MNWNWPVTDPGRAARARKVKILHLDLSVEPSAICAGSGAEPYRTTLYSCTCADFGITSAKGNQQPCKHMIALGMKLDLLNENGLTPSQQRESDIKSLRDKLAIAYGYFYLFKSPIISDGEYDLAKKQYDGLAIT